MLFDEEFISPPAVVALPLDHNVVVHVRRTRAQIYFFCLLCVSVGALLLSLVVFCVMCVMFSSLSFVFVFFFFCSWGVLALPKSTVELYFIYFFKFFLCVCFVLCLLCFFFVDRLVHVAFF